MKQVKNKVELEGYLREDTLEITKGTNGVDAIRGAITIAIDEIHSCKVQFYASKYRALKAGEITPQLNSTYEKLLPLLPSAVISMASIFKDNSAATFDTAKGLATKVWCIGALQEFARKDEKGEVISSVNIKGISAGIKIPTDARPFVPRSIFTTDIFIEGKREEIIDGEETGRIILTGLIPEYNGSVSRVDFVTGSDEASEFIRDNYSVQQTVTITGDVVNSYSRVIKEEGGSSFGRAMEPQYETTFVHERQILGGTSQPFDADDELGFGLDEIKAALVIRQTAIDEAPVKTADTPVTAAKTTGFKGSESAKTWASFDGKF